MAIRILYVEDEAALSQIVSESLIGRGFEVDIARDGEQAILKFTNSIYDICVLDIMLPKIDGYSVAEIITSKSPKLPIIFLTAKTQTKDVIKGFEVGGRDYLRKPFSMEELIVRIRNLVDHKPDIDTQLKEYKLGTFTFRPNRLELIKNGEVMQLSERESSLLSMLSEYKNNTCERRLILNKIWGDDSFYNSRNLDVYINKLRKLLSTDPSLEIVTLKSVGYVFKV